MGTYRDMIYDYKKRQDMRQHSVFKQIMSKYSLHNEQIGNSRYLLRQAHENITRDNKTAVVRLADWVQFYFMSGEKRKSIEDSYQARQYYGRTEEELESLSEDFYERLLNDGFQLTKQAAANIVYIMTIDYPYDDYMRCCNVVFQLRRKNQDMEFILTSPLDMENYGVDVMAKKEKLVNGITILPDKYFGKGKESSFKQQHEIFNMIWECSVIFIYAAVNGKITGELPQFKDIY